MTYFVCYNKNVNRFKTKTKENLGHFKLLFLVAAVFGLLFFSSRNNSKAAELFDCDEYFKNNTAFSTDCDQLSGDAKAKCEAYDKKIKTNCQMIEIKRKQGNTLEKQMLLIDIEQQKNQIELQKTQAKDADLSQQIADLEQEIKYKENLIKYQQLILAGLMQSYYEYDQEGVLKLVMANKNLSDVFNQGDYIEQSSDRVSEVLSTIKKEKAELQEKYDVLKNKKEESERVKKELEDKKANLQYTENQKQSLLTQTQGEEAKYQKLLARVEAQKSELFDFSTASNLDDVIGSVSSYKKPDSKYWNSDNFFSQRDSRWANKKIGGTKYLMKDFGCAVTSVAMAYQFDGKNYTPQTVLSSAGFTNQALIYWPAGWVKRGFNSSVVDDKLKDGKVVIVHIKKGSSAGHFVVIHHKPSDFKNINDYVVHDPYFGANLYLGTSRALVGKLGTNSSTSIDTMITY